VRKAAEEVVSHASFGRRGEDFGHEPKRGVDLDAIQKQLPAHFVARLKDDRIVLYTMRDGKMWAIELDTNMDKRHFSTLLMNAIRICHRFAERGPE
jgi:hypothetical protein